MVAKVPGPEAAGAARVVVAMEGARAEARESAGRAAVVTAAVAAMAAGLREEESNSYPTIYLSSSIYRHLGSPHYFRCR